MDTKPIELRMAAVTGQGLIFENRIYSHPLMIKHGWFENARVHGEWKIPVLFNPLNTGQLVLFEVETAELFVATEIEHMMINQASLDAYYKALQEIKEKLSLNEGMYG
ncbi:hypothetical protein N6H14_16415 [Paenibacillus sp. CC-CFT747]|nr:hypothetical protein N6H14_16415 [Paenibacillus sp. CC-CFT747]